MRLYNFLLIIPIYKKGCRTECGNYRGIGLLSVVGKIYARIVKLTKNSIA